MVQLVFNFNSNQWTFTPTAVQDFLDTRSRIDPENVDANFLLQHLRDLPLGTQQVLVVAAAIGPTFDARLVFAFMEDMDRPSSTDESDDLSEEQPRHGKKMTHAWVLGLQHAIVEGMIVAVCSLHTKLS
jgi:predicted ATPase